MPSPTAEQSKQYTEAIVRGIKATNEAVVPLAERSQCRSQTMRNSEAIEAQVNHNPPHVSIMNWSREFNVSGECFSKLEELLATHYTKNV
jgi:hypothetical protein